MTQYGAQHSVHPTGGSLRVFKHFVWLEAGSVKKAFSRPTHQRVTRAVGCSYSKENKGRDSKKSLYHSRNNGNYGSWFVCSFTK